MGSIVPPQSTNVALTLKTDYCGNMIYENGQLSKILTDVGYITLANSTPTYHYYLQNHLGNKRVVIDEHGQVEQVNHYYAFGGLMGESTGGGAQPYKYNGKELDRMHGLDWYDYVARHYDAVLTTLDIGGSLIRESLMVLSKINYTTKVSHPLKHWLFSFTFACHPPYPLTFNT